MSISLALFFLLQYSFLFFLFEITFAYGDSVMMRIREGTKAEYTGVLFTTEEYKNYLRVTKQIQEIILETKEGMKKNEW